MRTARTALMLLALISIAAFAHAQVLEATFDGTTAAVGPAGPVEGELIAPAELTDAGITGGGLNIPTSGGISYPATDLFPVNEGALQMWIRAGFTGTDDIRRWFFADGRERFRVFKYTNGNLYFQINPSEGGAHAFARCDWEPGEWHHVACIWRNINSGAEDGQLALYIDGSFAAGTTGKFTIPDIGDRLFVGTNSKGEESAESIIDDFQVFSEPKFHPNFPAGMVPSHDPDDYAVSALGATATASTEIMNFKGRDYPADVAIDGKVAGAYWASDFIFGTAEGPQWLEIDLGEPREVGRVYLYMVNTNVGTLLNDFTLSVRQGDEWVPVAEVSNYQEGVRSLDSLVGRYKQSYGVYRAEFEPMTTTAVRLDVPISTARVHEIEVLPPATATEPLVGTIRGAGPVLKFDFGTNTSAVAEGWLPVTESSTYSESAGYGWRDAEDLLPTDRRSGYPVTRDFVAAARDDGPVSGTFAVDLPNGRYAVTAITGDLAFAVEPFSITAEGETIAPRVITADSNDAVRSNGVVAVEDGRLDIGLAGEKAWLLNALVVAPIEQLDEVEASVVPVMDQFAIGSGDFLKGLNEVRPEAPASVLQPTAADRERGYQVFAHETYLEHIHRNVPPAQGEALEGLTLFATPGEREPATFALHALEPLHGVRVTPGALTGPGNIPAENIEVHLIHSWPQRYKMNPRDAWGVMPELLYEPDRSGEVWVATGSNAQWWLTVRVPDDAPAGDYTGTVTISRGDGADQSLPVALTVYPFELDWPRPMHWGIYYYPGQTVGPRVVDLDSLTEYTRRDLQDLRDHGLNGFAFSLLRGMASTDASAAPVIDVETDPVTVNLGYVQWVIDRINEVGGFEGPLPLYIRSAWMPDREDRERIIQQAARVIEDERIRRGWPELLYYAWDEPFREPEISEAAEPYRALSEVEGIRTYCTVSDEAGIKLDPWLDVRCHATSLGCGYQWPEVYDAAMESGDEYWWYSNCTREFPAVMRFKAGFHHWKSRATGQTYWNYRSYSGSPFCDFDGGPGDYITSYPGADGPIRSIQWECHREGIKDAKYAWTLELMVNEAEQSDDAGIKAAAAEGRAVLDRIRDEAHIDMDYYTDTYGDDLAFHYLSDWEATRYDTNRRAIAEAIVALIEAGAGR